MNQNVLQPCTAFVGHRRLAAGPLDQVALAVKSAEESAAGPVFVYDDATGHPIDIDIRGTPEEVVARLTPPAEADVDAPSDELRGRGRPKLGVVAREVTLLPRHWDWLNSQSGGASVALRKLVETARRANGDKDRRRAAQDAAYYFMSAVAGDLPGFQEAARALYAYDRRRFSEIVAAWPEDVRDHAVKLAFRDLESSAS